MGDPKKLKKKYQKPRHPWEKDRITEEIELIKEYGLKNKKEIWRLESKLREFRQQAKRYAGAKAEQLVAERDFFLAKLRRLGILEENSGLDDVLGLSVKDLMERRLQTIIVRKKLAASMRQARQFIVHRHISIKDKKIDVPSYLVKKDEEESIEYSPTSPLASEHSEVENITNKVKKKEAM